MATRITADTLIPGRGNPISNATMVTSGNNIVYAGPSAETEASRVEAWTTAARNWIRGNA